MSCVIELIRNSNPFSCRPRNCSLCLLWKTFVPVIPAAVRILMTEAFLFRQESSEYKLSFNSWLSQNLQDLHHYCKPKQAITFHVARLCVDGHVCCPPLTSSLLFFSPTHSLLEAPDRDYIFLQRYHDKFLKHWFKLASIRSYPFLILFGQSAG